MGVKLYSLAVAMFIFIAMAIMPAIAESSSNEKTAVIIGFKDKPDAAFVKAYGGEIKYQYDLIPAIAASLPEQAINGLKNNPNVAYVELDAKVHILEDDPATPWVEDDDFETPWGVDRIDAEKVHSTFTGEGVKVAVIDTGIDKDHNDLCVTDGESFVTYTTDYVDDNGHGTHVAGTIAALDNDEGVVGVAPNVTLYALKAFDMNGGGWTSDTIAAIEWADANGMDVISMSVGGGSFSQAEKDACDYAYMNGSVLVAAAGNDATNVVDYPAAYDSVIAVSATDDQDSIAYFSNRGLQIEITAPGVNIYSTILDGGYGLKNGTSMATPHVSGVVALMLSANSTLDPETVRSVLSSTATDLVDNPCYEGRDEYSGYGLVNASKAVNSAVVFSPFIPVCSDPSPLPDSDYRGRFAWSSVTVTVTTSEEILVPTVVHGKWIIDDEVHEVMGVTGFDGNVTFTSDKVRLDTPKFIPDNLFSFVVTSPASQ